MSQPEELELGELIDQFIDQEKIYQLEGQRGVSNMERITQALGYDNFDEFLSDNSGAIEAIQEWISRQDVPEWRESVQSHLNNQ
jgi:hypothetical protein